MGQKIIISLNYYAMYQVARAVVFHTFRDDVDNHERLATEFGKILGKDYEDKMIYWRKSRNEVDYSAYPRLDGSLEELSRQSIIEVKNFIKEAENYLNKRGVKL